jgi:prolyl-tRNA editing enzyme YbaK/EbsC (Cys-tRNA(Pro) deacylase)
VVATVMVLQAPEGPSDREAISALRRDIVWKVACGLRLTTRASIPPCWCTGATASAPRPLPQRILQAVRQVVEQTGVLFGQRWRVLDSTVLEDAVATQDTVTQLVAAIRRSAGWWLRPRDGSTIILVDGAIAEYAESPVEWTGVRVMSRVREHLESHGVPFEPIAHQQTYTSIAEARALGIDASEVLKTVAVQVAGGHALMVVPATCRLDLHLVQAAVGDRHARLATEAELQREFPDVELGALPPLALLLGGPLYVDPEVLQHEMVVVAAGSQTESVKLRTADLFRFQQEQVTTAPLTRQADEDDKEWLP